MNILRLWIIMFLMLPTLASAQHTCVQSATLNLRSTPNTNSTIIAKLSKGTEVLIQYKENAEWAYVLVDGRRGYVATQYLGVCSTSSNDLYYMPSNTTQSNTRQQRSQSTNRTYETPQASSNKTVLVCTSPNAYAYHTYQCRGLKRCSRSIAQMSESQARAQNYRPCQICH